MFPAKIQLIDETGDKYALNCRKVNGLLSAYMDAELSDAEMPIIQDHLESCPKCRQEYDTLRETKRM
ncbi:MAG: zf-HC2 domain-containing protein, partial [bacterium]